MSSPIVYHPCPVKLPAHLGWQRDIQQFVRDIKPRRPSFDQDTLFYDVFRSPDCRKIIAMGPKLHNLAARVLPLRVYCHGRQLRYRDNQLVHRRLGLYWSEGLHILEIFADEEDLVSDEPLELVFRWKSFEQRMMVPPNPLAALPPVTLQKDSLPQWLRDWCLYYHRVHGVERVVLYDNGSADAAVLPEHLAGLDAGLQVIVVDWNFPYGNHANIFCQHGSLNHCPRIFGNRTAYYLNFDVDEYLVNRTSQPLVGYLEKRLTGMVSSLQFIGIPVPNTTLDGNRPARVYDFNVRCKLRYSDPVKTIFRYKGVEYVRVHDCFLQMSKAGLLVKQLLARLCHIWEWLYFRCGVRAPFHRLLNRQVRLPGCYLQE